MTQRADYIIPECYVDTNLVQSLACPSGCNHQKGCNQVVKIMQEKFSDRFAVGIIDADKRKPGYLNEFKEIASSEHLKVLRHGSKSHFIILVKPAIDGFILSCAKAGDINMSKFGLSDILKIFTTQTKNVMSNSDERFQKLFKELKGIGEMRLIGELLNYFVCQRYDSKTDEIIEIFKNR